MGEKTMSLDGKWVPGKTNEEVLRDLVRGYAAKWHHGPNVFDLAKLFLSHTHESSRERARLGAEWLAGAIADSRARDADYLRRRARNHKRAQARSLARKRQRSAGLLAALPAATTQPENPGCVAPVTAEGSQAENKFWDAVREVAKSR
jgi:hypothetical protein